MEVADVAVADIDLPAVENVVVAVPFRGGLHAEDKASGVGFCDRDRRQAIPSGYGRQPVFFLNFVAEVKDFRDAQLGCLHHGAHRAADAGEFLDNNRLRHVPEAHAAVLLSYRHAYPSLAGDQAGQGVLDGLGGLHFRYERPDSALREFPDPLA
jgi:hypothetical protein